MRSESDSGEKLTVVLLVNDKSLVHLKSLDPHKQIKKATAI